MQDMIFGILLLGMTSGVIPAILIIFLIKGLIWLFKGMAASVAVLTEEAPQPVVRNIREELWDEKDGDFIDQYLQEREDANA
jgi:hypothetical protein